MCRNRGSLLGWSLAVVLLGSASASPLFYYDLGMQPTGESTFDRFGCGGISFGDVNGDGYDDVLVPAHLNDGNGYDAGRVYLYFGGPVLDGVADLILTGETLINQLGGSAEFVGDVNADGYEDFLLSAVEVDIAFQDAGRAYLHLGGAIPDPLPDVIIDGKAPGDFLGACCNGAGDVNGDGYDDFLVSARYNDTAANNAGQVYLFHGGETPDSVADLTFNGEAANDYFAGSSASAGDVNGDGYDDVVLGTHLSDAGGVDAGRVYVYLGGPTMDAVADLVITGPTAGAGLTLPEGYHPGDLNGDGFDDIVVTDGAHPGGRVTIYFGAPTLDAVADLVLLSTDPTENLGFSADVVRDLNGDGCDDLIVGGPAKNPDSDYSSHRAYVFFGGPILNSAPDIVFTGAPGENYGLHVCGGGDVNGDGFADLGVTAPWWNGSVGRAYIYTHTGRRARTALWTDDHASGGLPSDWTPTQEPKPCSPSQGMLALESPAPNPFSTLIQIAYAVPRRVEVRLTIHDSAGRLVRLLETSQREPGNHSAVWDGRSTTGERVAPGVYFCRLQTGEAHRTRSLVYVR